MKMCTSTIGFRNMSLEETLIILDELGFEYFEGTTDARAHIYPYITGERKVSELEDILASFNARIVAISGQSDFGFSDEHIEKQIRLVEKQMELASRLQAPILRIFASHIPREYVNHTLIKRIIRNIRKASILAERMNVRLAVENHYGITATAEDVIQIIEAVCSDYVGVNFDPANFVSSGEDPVKAGKKLSSRIFHTHLKDCIYTGKGKYLGYDYVEVGSGIIDYHSILSDLKEINYKGYLSLEYEKTEDSVIGNIRGRRNLRSILANL